MKDWKAECDKLRGELAEVRKQLDRAWEVERCRREREDRFRQTFKELLLDTLRD